MSQSKARKARIETLVLNNDTYNFWQDVLEEIVINLYEWHNIPDTMDERFLELTLLNNGKAILFVDEIIGILGLPFTDNGLRNIYNMPTIREIYSNANDYHTVRNQRDSVIIYNNYLRTPSTDKISLYAKKLYEISRAIDTNVRLQKTSKIIGATEAQQLSMQNAIASYDGNFPFIFTSNDFSLDSVQDFNVDTPYVSDKLEILLHDTINDFLTYFGVPNNPVQKKERLITDEANGNEGIVSIFQNSGLSARNKACKEFNQMIKTLSKDIRYSRAIKRSWKGDIYVTFRGETDDTRKVIKESELIAENKDVPRETILKGLYKLFSKKEGSSNG